jgi:phosphoribosylamine--glycine ligase
MSVGVLVVSYGSREAAMVDALARSEHYDVKLYIADKQRNPFNLERAKEHVIIPGLDVAKIADFAVKHRDEIEFGVVGSEGPIIAGLRDIVQKKAGIPFICPTKEYAIEESKLKQRILLSECCPDANPSYKVFDPKKDGSVSDVKEKVFSWFDELESRVVVKPDKPGLGKGVGVWGDHFRTKEEFFEYFKSNYASGTVIIEEKIEGEESSFQAFCDGKTLVPLPETRDYKRAFDGDEGPNTGGMGSYKDVGNWLPFMTDVDYEKEVGIAQSIFRKLRGKGRNDGLLGVPFYIAFMHTGREPKILEINSRPGDPESMNIIPALNEDFVDLCYAMLDGKLKKISMKPKATVVTYKVPASYGGYDKRFVDKKLEGVGGTVNLSEAYRLVEKTSSSLRVYPGSMEERDGGNYALKSRAIACIGMGDSIDEARELSVKGIESIRGGGLWSRSDVAAKQHIQKSINHMMALRE